jgi:hypothetical protein
MANANVVESPAQLFLASFALAMSVADHQIANYWTLFDQSPEDCDLSLDPVAVMQQQIDQLQSKLNDLDSRLP